MLSLFLLAAGDAGGGEAVDFSLVAMWGKMGIPAKMVVIILFAMSVYSIYVMIERFMLYRKAAQQSRDYVQQMMGHLQRDNIQAAAKTGESFKASPIAKVSSAGLDEYIKGLDAATHTGPHDVGGFDVVDAVNRSLDRVKEREVADLKRGLGGLATIGSAAPFVGLFGTVVGIINTFQQMNKSGGGGLAAVSGGISEALITTAFGLLVAIPAVMMYNFFTNKVEGFVVDIN